MDFRGSYWMLLQGKKETQTHDQAYGTYGPICTPVALSSASFPPAQALSPEESRPREARPEDSSTYIYIYILKRMLWILLSSSGCWGHYQ